MKNLLVLMSVFPRKQGEGKIFRWRRFSINHNLLKQEWIPASISDNDFGCEFFFFKLSARYVLKIITKTLFAPAQFPTSWTGHCIQWSGKKAELEY